MGEPQDPYSGRPYQPPPFQPPYQPYPPRYPSSPYPQQYPPSYGPQYVPYPTMPPPFGLAPRRPGMATAAAVLAYVTSGLLMLAAVMLFVGAAFIFGDSNSIDGPFSGGVGGEVIADGIVNLVSATLLLVGGLKFSTRAPVGLAMMIAGSGVTVICSIYWIVRPPDTSGTLYWALIFAALVIVSTGLAVTPTVRTWLGTRR